MMGKGRNPFLVKGYHSKELFCDRENELVELFNNATNGVDTTLVSPRKLGKTGLIFRFLDLLEETEGIEGLYVDIFSTKNLADFIKTLAEAILQKFPEKSEIGQRFIELIKGLRPLLGWNPLTGLPQVSITFQTPQEKEHTLQGLLNFLDQQGCLIVVAIDEFQQITDYPESNIEALIRTCIQNLKNVRFVFCGSRKSILYNIFSNSKRPFYQSTQYLNLGKIDPDKYRSFITQKFSENEVSIDDEALEWILEWTQGYTFYTQSICNLLYYMAEDQVGIELAKMAGYELLKRNEPTYYQYRLMLTPAQWNFLIAVAKEGEVKQLTAQKFINTYEIGTPANARRISQSLIEKELILQESDKTGVTYRVYDLFFLHWLANEF